MLTTQQIITNTFQLQFGNFYEKIKDDNFSYTLCENNKPQAVIINYKKWQAINNLIETNKIKNEVKEAKIYEPRFDNVNEAMNYLNMISQ